MKWGKKRGPGGPYLVITQDWYERYSEPYARRALIERKERRRGHRRVGGKHVRGRLGNLEIKGLLFSVVKRGRGERG